jgi:hypothetical protein
VLLMRRYCADLDAVMKCHNMHLPESSDLETYNQQRLGTVTS